MAEKFKSITVGSMPWSEEETEFYFVVHGNADVGRMMADQAYCLSQVICQTETVDWANKIAAALNV